MSATSPAMRQALEPVVEPFQPIEKQGRPAEEADREHDDGERAVRMTLQPGAPTGGPVVVTMFT